MKKKKKKKLVKTFMFMYLISFLINFYIYNFIKINILFVCMCIKSVCVVCKVLTGAGCWTGKKNF